MQHSKPPLRDRCAGRWPGILASLGVPKDLLNTRKHHPCPFCGGKDRFRFTDKDGSGAFYCNQCKGMGPADFLMRSKGWDFAQTAREIESVMGEVRFRSTASKGNDRKHRAAMQALWDRCRQIEAGDFVDRWFANRGVRQEHYSRWLRKAESVEHVSEDGVRSFHPAMVAKIIAPDGSPTNLHRTYLTKEGRKANVDNARKTMPGTIAPGSAIRLMDPGLVLGIAEGIETAFAASELFRVPVWAAISANVLAKWEPPEGTQQVIIFGDNDPKYGGQASATALAHRLACKGLAVNIEIPPAAGEDWNDVLLRRAA